MTFCQKIPPKKRTFTKTEVTDKLYVLDRLKRENLEHLSLTEKAKKATEWLKRDVPFVKNAIKYWIDNEEKLRREAASFVPRSKHDPRGTLSVKTVRSGDEHEFSEAKTLAKTLDTNKLL